jgi:stage II sporulation protein R
LIEPGFVRIQVIANSDSEADQQVKALVRDTLREMLTHPALKLETAEAAQAYARESLPELEAAVRACLEGQKCTYDCVLSVGKMMFPAKSYGGVVVPPGEYPALRVALGQAGGANWWCVLFPPLCFVDIGTSLAREPEPQAPALGIEPGMTDEQIVAAVRLALEKQQREQADGGPAGIRVRSWVLDKLHDSGWWTRVWQGLRTLLAAGGQE